MSVQRGTQWIKELFVIYLCGWKREPLLRRPRDYVRDEGNAERAHGNDRRKRKISESLVARSEVGVYRTQYSFSGNQIEKDLYSSLSIASRKFLFMFMSPKFSSFGPSLQ
jgi:hypothetical protein